MIPEVVMVIAMVLEGVVIVALALNNYEYRQTNKRLTEQLNTWDGVRGIKRTTLWE